MHAAQCLGCLGDHAVDLVFAGDVGGEGEDTAVRFGGEFSGGCFEVGFVAGDDGDVDTFAGEFTGDGFADASAAAGYDGMFAL
jgi:hypothetical protein